MPRLTKSHPKYRKHSSGNARVTINGRDYLLGPWQSKTSIREYDRIIAEYLTSGRSPTLGIEAEAYTVAMLTVVHSPPFERMCQTKLRSRFLCADEMICFMEADQSGSKRSCLLNQAGNLLGINAWDQIIHGETLAIR